MRLTQLSTGDHATISTLSTCIEHPHAATLERLGELGFLPGEPVRLLKRGPGGREPLAVLVGETQFALRWAEAHCIEVQPA